MFPSILSPSLIITDTQCVVGTLKNFPQSPSQQISSIVSLHNNGSLSYNTYKYICWQYMIV